MRQAVRLGRLQPGDQLPEVKDVVANLQINPNTVLKAYRELDTEGIVDSRRGRETFVSTPSEPHSSETIRRCKTPSTSGSTTRIVPGSTRKRSRRYLRQLYAPSLDELLWLSPRRCVHAHAG